MPGPARSNLSVLIFLLVAHVLKLVCCSIIGFSIVLRFSWVLRCRGVSVLEDEGTYDDHRSGIASTDGQWHHVAVTWSSSDGQVNLYDNGRKVTLPTHLLDPLVQPKLGTVHRPFLQFHKPQPEHVL